MTRKKPKTTKTIKENYQTAQTVLSAQPATAVDAAIEIASVTACILGAKLLIDQAHKVYDMMNGDTLGIPNYLIMTGGFFGGFIGLDVAQMLVTHQVPDFITHFGIPQLITDTSNPVTHQEYDAALGAYVQVMNGYHLDARGTLIKDADATLPQITAATSAVTWQLAIVFGLLGFITLKYAGSAIAGGVLGFMKSGLASFAFV